PLPLQRRSTLSNPSRRHSRFARDCRFHVESEKAVIEICKSGSLLLNALRKTERRHCTTFDEDGNEKQSAFSREEKALFISFPMPFFIRLSTLRPFGGDRNAEQGFDKVERL
ncbi:hypothetical protein, partial [uncultured Bilophila sp.]|uniref:hypothetical protein n=1 Tax=uncultured Bilophila sp. TaxID=529385 RepID=UPI0026DAA039